ncbi:MAG: hypothetical protein M1828_000809 [Chrysothrix sp. TS-e1954]|nr:MAG: hypothetical protein M1828_000809 [Chrysothrix sp. TS-e1954]
MPPSKRLRQASSQPKVNPMESQKSLRAFARLTKPASASQKNDTSDTHALVADIENPSLNKRKVVFEGTDHSLLKRRRTSPSRTSPDAVNAVEDPKRSTRNAQLLPTPEATPVKAAKFTNVASDVEPLASPEFRPVPTTSHSSSNQATSAQQSEQVPDRDIRDELLDLYTCFLKALSLHRAHHGSTVPANLRVLLPSVSKIWGKRQVTLLDIRRLIGQEGYGTEDLRLTDYGQGRILVEVNDQGSSKLGMPDADRTAAFKHILQLRWTRWSEDNQQPSSGDQSFEQTLPLAPILRSTTLEKIAPLFTKGQKRLTQIKEAAQNAQKPSSAAARSSTLSTTRKSANLKSRSNNLLEHLEARKALLATLPAGPSKYDLERKAALSRLDEIVSTISLTLGSAGNRNAFSRKHLVQSIQKSTRSPLSSSEIDRCLTLLAAEIAPDFIRCVNSGSVTGLVIDHRKKPLDLDLRIANAARR